MSIDVNVGQSTSNSYRPLRHLINEFKSSSNSICRFAPIIHLKKYEEPIGEFTIRETDLTRDGVQRSQTFSNTEDVLSNKTNSDHRRNSLTNNDRKHEAKREAIAKQMYETEKSYVEALKNLVTKYYLPLKDKDLVSNDLLNDIFYKIPEIHIHHTAFLISLSEKLNRWNRSETIGDLLVQMFSRMSVIESYTSFIENYDRAQLALNVCRDSSSFNKFVEQQIRDHRGKLSLNDLLIQPVQRIPRYELLIKDFVQSTDFSHPDYQLLLKAQSQIHLLAQQIDQVHKQQANSSLRIVEQMIEHRTDLVDRNRYLIRIDHVPIQLSSSPVKKDRCLFLFNDLLLITNSKRKANHLNKKNQQFLILNSSSGKQYIENDKYKLIVQMPLDKIEIIEDDRTVSNSDKQKSVEEDFLILGQMSNLSKTISIPHQQLDDAIKETFEIVNKELKRSNSIQLIFNSTEQIEKIELLFSSFETKSNWQQTFVQAKKIQLDKNEQSPVFEQVVKLCDFRPGTELSCGIGRCSSNDLCLCSNEGEIYLLNCNLNVESLNSIGKEQINTIESIPSTDSIWIGTQSGKLFIYKSLTTKNRFVKQLNSSIHSILYEANRVYIGLAHRQLCLFKQDSNGEWDLENPLIETIDENVDEKMKTNPIRVMCFVQDKLWCAIDEQIFVLCPNSFRIQHWFAVDEYRRQICSMVKDSCWLNCVWIATQDSHEISLFDSRDFHCLLVLNIRQSIVEKLETCDDVLRCHKLGCLHIRTMSIYENILWIGTSAGIILFLKLSQLTTKFDRNLIEFECLPKGHSGPVCLFLSKTIEHCSSSMLISIGYGFEQFHFDNEQILGKDDSFIHLLFWKI